MSNSKKLKSLLYEAAFAGRHCFDDLTDQEKRESTAFLLEASPELLLESDLCARLQSALAFVIKTNGHADSINQLVFHLNRIFIDGDINRYAYFASYIDDMLHDICSDINGQVNEHFINDAMNRAHDAKLARNALLAFT